MPKLFEIENKLNGYYPGTKKLTTEILAEYGRVCGGWTMTELESAIEKYRQEDKKGEFCPDAWRLKKYGPASKQQSIELRDRRAKSELYRVIELEGWERGIKNIMNNNCGPDLREYVVRAGINNMWPYECFDEIEKEYFKILHDNNDPIAACSYMANTGKSENAREWWRQRRSHYESMGIEKVQKIFPGIRWKLYPGKAKEVLDKSDLKNIFEKVELETITFSPPDVYGVKKG